MKACDRCVRRSGLLAALAGRIDRALRERRRLPALLALDDRSLIAALGLGKQTDRTLASLDVASIRDRAGLAGLHTVCRHDDDFPPALRGLEDRCGALFVRGAPELLERLGEDRGVAVVGSRRASPYGCEVATVLGRELSACGVTVISGMAFGADAAAHTGALERPGLTVAVLACGADSAYPRRHHGLYERIVRQGLVLSEFPPGFRPFRWCFPARNRLMAGLAAMTVVVEGAADSGSLITAQFAQELGREVGAVPGRITSELAAGPNGLIADGVCVVRSTSDVLDAVFGVGVAPSIAVRQSEAIVAGLEPALRELLESVERGHGTAESLASDSVDVAAIVCGLTELELLGLIRCEAGGRYIRCVS